MKKTIAVILVFIEIMLCSMSSSAEQTDNLFTAYLYERGEAYEDEWGSGYFWNETNFKQYLSSSELESYIQSYGCAWIIDNGELVVEIVLGDFRLLVHGDENQLAEISGWFNIFN